MDPLRAHLQFLDAYPEPLRLSYLGGLIPNAEDFSNPFLQCVCYPDSASGAPIEGSGILVHAGLAALGAMQLGTTFLQGKVVSATRSRQTRLRIEISPVAFEERNLRVGVRGVGVSHGGHDDPVVKVPTKTGLANCWKIGTAAERGITESAWQLKVYIPDIEIIRYFYANSNHLVKALFSGHFQKDMLYTKVLSDSIGKAFYDEEKGRHWMQYRSEFSQHDVPIIARIVFDKLASAGANRVFSSFTRSLQLSRQSIGYARTHFPFVKTAQLIVVGRRCDVGGKKAFYVERIEACNQPYPFLNLAAMPNASDARSDTDADPLEQKLSVIATGPALQNGAMNSLALAASNSVAATSQPDLRFFPGTEYNITFESPPSTKSAGGKRLFIKNSELTETSPGGTTSGHTNALRQTLADELVNGKAPEGLADFMEMLEALKKYAKLTSYRTIPVGREAWTHVNTGVTYSAFPRADRSGKLSRFSFVERQRRYFIVAELEHPSEGYYYILKAQPRNLLDGEDPQLGVFVVTSPENLPIASVDLEFFIRACVDHSGWAKKTAAELKWDCRSFKNTGGSVTKMLHERIGDAIVHG